MKAIRIIRELTVCPNLDSLFGIETDLESPPAPDTPNIEDTREQLRSVAKVITESLKFNSPERIDASIRRYQRLNRDNKPTEEILHSLESTLHLTAESIGVHADLDISRILELLED